MEHVMSFSEMSNSVHTCIFLKLQMQFQKMHGRDLPTYMLHDTYYMYMLVCIETTYMCISLPVHIFTKSELVLGCLTENKVNCTKCKHCTYSDKCMSPSHLKQVLFIYIVATGSATCTVDWASLCTTQMVSEK